MGWAAAATQYPSIRSINCKTLGWTNIDQIQIVFSQDVSVQQASLALTGVSGGSYSFASFDYNEATFTATWTLAAPLAADKLHIDLQSSGPAAVENLAGSGSTASGRIAVSHYPSGNGTAGGDFNFAFNVLPGDANQDGVVNGLDIQQVASNWIQSSFAGDVNGDNVINGLDLNNVACPLAFVVAYRRWLWIEQCRQRERPADGQYGNCELTVSGEPSQRAYGVVCGKPHREPDRRDGRQHHVATVRSGSCDEFPTDRGRRDKRHAATS